MRRILIITAVLALLLVGCTQDVDVQKPTTPTDSVMTPTEGTESPTAPSNPEPDSTEGTEQTTPTEPSEGSQEPHEIMPWDIEQQFNGFKFGHMGIAVKNRGYMWYPGDIAEMTLDYEKDGVEIRYYARVCVGAKDPSQWQHEWTTHSMYQVEHLNGPIRTCVKNGERYNSLLWYDTQKDLTYVLEWTGATEFFEGFLAADAFLDISNRPIDAVPSEQPRQVTADELKSLMNNKFMFGDKGLLGKPAYVWYPQGIAEMQFMYRNIKYYARAYEGYADIACWNHQWVKPYGESDDLHGLTGQVRRCKIDNVVYTSILWYDEERNLTFTLDWTGGREDYITFVTVVFLDELGDYIIPLE